MGRPSKYTDDIPDKMLAHFAIEKSQKVCVERAKKYSAKTGQLTSDVEKYKIIPNDMPTFFGFSQKIGVSHDTLLDWSKAVVDPEAEEPELKYPEFSEAYNACKHLQKAFLIDNALQGNSPPATFIFVAKNVTDMTDKQIIETKDNDLKAKSDAISDFLDSIRDKSATADNSNPAD